MRTSPGLDFTHAVIVAALAAAGSAAMTRAVTRPAPSRRFPLGISILLLRWGTRSLRAAAMCREGGRRAQVAESPLGDAQSDPLPLPMQLYLS